MDIAVDFVALFQEQLGKVDAILSADPGNERLAWSFTLP
jgi:hypothetical protein